MQSFHNQEGGNKQSQFLRIFEEKYCSNLLKLFSFSRNTKRFRKLFWYCRFTKFLSYHNTVRRCLNALRHFFILQLSWRSYGSKDRSTLSGAIVAIVTIIWKSPLTPYYLNKNGFIHHYPTTVNYHLRQAHEIICTYCVAHIISVSVQPHVSV